MRGVISLRDFYAQAWNAHVVGFISPAPEETTGEDLTILVRVVAEGRSVAARRCCRTRRACRPAPCGGSLGR